jgi:hypothetical protein
VNGSTARPATDASLRRVAHHPGQRESSDTSGVGCGWNHEEMESHGTPIHVRRKLVAEFNA